MEVFINHTSVKIFKGAHLRNAILKYSEESYKQLMSNQIEIEDEKGNLMDEDGQVWDGMKLFIKHKSE